MTIQLNREGYDPFIDFIKAFAIICVLMGHTFPYLNSWGYALWAGMQVPLFLLVQTFHSYKTNKPGKLNVKKLFERIMLPFIIAEIIIFICLILRNESINNLIHRYLVGGGVGPGSYYPWIYLQFAIILPFLKPFFDRFSVKAITIVSLLVSILAEIICALIDMPDAVYRLLALRYLFLIYIGWLWVRDGIKINVFTIILSIISLASVIIFVYFPQNLEPFFYNTAWHSHRWPCYIWVAYLGVFILYNIWEICKRSQILTTIIRTLAHCSYEIFLIQMVLIGIGTHGLFLQFTGNRILSYGLYILFIFVFSIGFGILIRQGLDTISKRVGIKNAISKSN